MDELLQKLKDGNLTIAEAFELGRPDVKLYRNDGKPSALLKKLQDAGFKLSDNWDSIGDRTKHDTFNKIASSPDYVALGKVESSLTKMAASEDFDYPYTNRFEAGKGTIRVAKVKGDPTKLRFPNATQPRGEAAAKKITLPSIEDLNRAIHATTLKLKGNKEAVAFFQLKHLLGIRNRDLINLTVGEAIEDSPYGTLDPGSNTLYGISNKGQRTNYQLPSLAQDILADLGTDAKGRMGDSKSISLFTQKEGALRTAINNAMNETLSEMGLEIIDQKTNKRISFTISDLRKNVFDAINESEGAGVANVVLGHSTKGDVGLTHYAVGRQSRRKMSIVQRASEEFGNMYLQDINQVNPKKLYKTYGFNEDFFKETSVIPFTAPTDELSQKTRGTTLQVEGTAADVSKTSDILTKQAERKVSNLEKSVNRLKELNEQMTELGGTQDVQPTKTVKKKAPPKGSPIELSDKAKSAFDKAWDALSSDTAKKAFTGLAVGELARQIIDNPAQAAQDVATELLLERGLGMGPGAAVGFAMQSSPAGAGSELRPTDPSAEYRTISDDQYANMTSMGLETSKQDMATTNPMNYAMDQQMTDLLRKDIPDEQGIM